MDILKGLGIIGDDLTDFIDAQYNGSRKRSLWEVAVEFENDSFDCEEDDFYD